MRTMRVLGLTLLLLATTLASVRAAPPDEKKPPRRAASTQWKSERFALTVRGPAGWTQTIEEPRSSGNWIDLVAYREEKSKAYLKISCQASSYSGFDQMRQKVGAHYTGLKDIQIIQGPEIQPRVMGVRSQGLYLVYIRTVGKTPDKAFLAYYINGRFVVRVYGVVAEKKYAKVEPALTAFLGSLRFLSRGAGNAKPNFVHEASKCALVFPEGWTVNLPARGPIAKFVGERLGVAIWLYREDWKQSLSAYGKHRREVLKRGGAKEIVAPEPSAHPKRGEPVLTLEFDQGQGDKTRHFREVCLVQRGAVYRLALGGVTKAFPNGLPALEQMVETLRFK